MDMKYLKPAIIPVILISALASGGCSSATKALGLTKQAPNEFNILTKAPLIVPPEYNLLPPRVGESSSENNYSQKAARDALIGNIDAAEPSRGEIVLMSKAGVGQANQEIRVEIDGQNSVERKTRGFASRVLFWQDLAVPNTSNTRKYTRSIKYFRGHLCIVGQERRHASLCFL